jgi:MFS family permease
VLGLANAFKPNLGFVLGALTLGWLVDRAWRRLLLCWLGVLFGAGVAVALSTLLFDSLRPWFDWFALLRSIERHYGLTVGQGNFGGARLLGDLLGWSPVWLLQLAGWGLLLGALLPGRGRERAPEAAFRREYLLLATGAILPMLSTGLAWPHYLMLAVPLVLVVFVAPGRDRAHHPVFLALGLVALLGVLTTFPLTWLGASDPWLYAAPLAGSCLLFFGLGLAELRRTG